MKANRNLVLQLTHIHPVDLSAYVLIRNIARILAGLVLVSAVVYFFLSSGVRETFPNTGSVKDTALGVLLFGGLACLGFHAVLSRSSVLNPLRDYLLWEERFTEFFGKKLLQCDHRIEVVRGVEESFITMAFYIAPLKIPPEGSVESLMQAHNVASERLKLRSFDDLCDEARRRHADEFFT